MSWDFFLQPLDGGAQVPVRPGQTVIGRGPLLGITDKRVSRRHAILEVVDNQLRIKPIHTNPCFHQSSEKSQLLPMKTHVWCWLNPGDIFSLLLNKYSFRVFSTQTEEEVECTLRNSQIFDEDDVLSEMQKSPVINLPDKTTGTSQLQGSPEITKAKCTAIEPMEVPESLSSITLSDTDVDSVKINEPSNAVPIEELGEVSKHKTVSKATANEEGETVRHAESHSGVHSKSLLETSQGFHPKSSSAPSSPDASHTMADSVLGSSEESKVQRVSCMYGANCYRKNPLHFQHFSHPGDSDYGDIQVTDEGETGDRPECPYGASCYRKNPQHKMEYRHSALPVRDKDNDDGGHPSENDLNDSFLEDDDEEEGYEPTDEDSDWQPEKDDEEKEDVEELLKEAKRFMKRKK
ncbi:aprataxin and PNK-like factor isoform 2 [Cricetulus griseus]|nr:aprataxin and PNK-like factor isoform 2 [Cricetulus griseus]